jgi:signal transduction histidine kinase
MTATGTALELEARLEDTRPELVVRVEQVLRETLFTSRAFVRPADIKRLAASETGAFLLFLERGDEEAVIVHGAELCREGLGDQAILRLGQVLREFCAGDSQNGQLGPCSDIAETYHRLLLVGFFRAHEAIILEEQERIRSAVQHTLHSFNRQIAAASEIARVTTSMLDLGDLLTTSVDLIADSFAHDYVGIYLLDDARQAAVLRAATGLEGRKRLATGHRLKLGGASTVSTSLLTRSYVIVNDVDQEPARLESSWVTGIRSELVLPLTTHGQVAGALAVQCQRPGAFSTQDVPGYQIIADQLASAIENAYLYADTLRRANELSEAYGHLKELDRLKDEFLRNVSHELRTPLTLIIGYTERMAKGSLGQLTAEQQHAIDVVVRSSRSLLSLIENLLSMAELRARKASTAPVSVTELVELTVNDFKVLAEGKEIRLRTEIAAADSLPKVPVQPDHIRRILDNLLSNAVKFTPNEGEILVRVWSADGSVFLEITDTGIGIPITEQERIFDAFYQVDGSIRRRYGGTGIGLSLVKELVLGNGGSIKVASAGPNLGSVFTVSFPTVNE